MPEMTRAQIMKLNQNEITRIFKEAARKEREHEAITWEFGTDLVSIVTYYGDLLAEALYTAQKY